VRLGLVDAADVVVSEWYETEAVLALDRRGLRAVAPLTGRRAFRVLPGDL
jgi:hypothetical protein